MEAPQARFHVTWLARSQHGSPAFEQLRQVFGVDRSLPPPAIGFVNAKAGVFAPALIEEVDAPVRKRSPYQSGKRIDDAAELVLHSRSFRDSGHDTRMRHSTGGRPSCLGVGLQRDGGDFERISARSMTFCSSRMLLGHSYCRSRFPSSCATRFV